MLLIKSKGRWILIGALIVLLGGTLTYFGWTKQESTPVSSQTDETKPKLVDQIMIPPSTNSKEVIKNVIGLPHYTEWEEWKSREQVSSSWKEFWGKNFGIPFPGKQVIGYALAPWQWKYQKRDGTMLLDISEATPFVLYLYVFKYEKPKFAKEDYDKINQNFKTRILEGIKLKSKPGIAPIFEEFYSQINPEEYQQYLLNSNNFVIYVFGLKEAVKDITIRLIEHYEMK